MLKAAVVTISSQLRHHLSVSQTGMDRSCHTCLVESKFNTHVQSSCSHCFSTRSGVVYNHWTGLVDWFKMLAKKKFTCRVAFGDIATPSQTLARMFKN